jgi:SNF2 family DNA or RNA helicase
MTVQCCSLPGQVHHLKWWLMTLFVDDVDTCNMYAEMGNNERTEIHLKFQDSRNPSVFIPTPKVDVTGLNLTAVNQAVITQKCWVLHEQRRHLHQSSSYGTTEYHTHCY